MDDNETVSPFEEQALPGSLQAKFTAAKSRLQEAKDALDGVLKEMIAAGQGKVIEDAGGEFPDITIVAPEKLLARICSFSFKEGCSGPIWLDEEGYLVPIRAHENLEWF